MEQVPNGNERIGRLEVAVIDLSGIVADFSARLTRLEATVTDLLVRVGRLEVRVENLVREFAEFKTEVRADLKDLHAQVEINFRILAGMIIALGLGMGVVMAKGFGWI